MKIAHYINDEIDELDEALTHSSWQSFSHWVLRAAILSGLAALTLAIAACR